MSQTTNKTAAEFRAAAAEARAKQNESFDRCDTDGFVSQFAHGLSAREDDLAAEIAEAGGTTTFEGLYDGDRRLKAREIRTQYGRCWLLHEDEERRYGRKFVPTGSRSRVQKQKGLAERTERAPAAAAMGGNGKGLSGLTSCYVYAARIGDEWGQDSQLEEPSA